jgi:predicted transcriptional regulator
MTKSRIQLTDAEFAVLQGLWDGGPQTIRELADRLYPGGGVSEYATVQKLLDRLESKACAVRDRSKHAHVFQASAKREDLIDSQLQQLAEKLCEGSLTPVLLQLVQHVNLSSSDRDVIRKLLEDASQRRDAGQRRDASQQRKEN